MSGDAPEAEFWCSLCKAFGHDDIACDDVPQPVPWWWTDEGRAAHDAAIRAEAWDEGANAAVEPHNTGTRMTLKAVIPFPENPYRAAQPTEGESSFVQKWHTDPSGKVIDTWTEPADAPGCEAGDCERPVTPGLIPLCAEHRDEFKAWRDAPKCSGCSAPLHDDGRGLMTCDTAACPGNLQAKS